MSGNKIKRDLPNNEYQAAVGANSPSALNVFATIADLTSGGGIQHGVAAGTNTYTVAIPGVVSYTDGDSYVVRFTNGNDDDSTININGLGAVTLVKQANVQVTGGDILSGQELLLVYDGTNFQCIEVSPNQLFAFVTNDEPIAITKGQPVYAFGSTGNRMTVKLAFNTSDATSAQTIGVVYSPTIAQGQTGFIIIQGVVSGIDTSMYAPGDQLYLGATAGTVTNVKPYAPNHLVYIGIVERANAGNGQIYIRTQNGYELDELHDVDLITTPPTIGDVLTFDGTLWVPQAGSSSGRFGIADSTGAYTYYTTLTLAMTAAVSGQTIEFFTDYTETGAVTITLKDGVNINMNGHTYTSTYSVAAITLFDIPGIVRMQFLNGKIVIDSGAVNTLAIGGTSASGTDIDCTGLFVEVISSGGLGSVFSARGVIRNLRGVAIDSACATLVRSSAYNCNFSTTGTGFAVVLGGNVLGTPGVIYDSRVTSADMNFQGSMYNTECGAVNMDAGYIEGGSITTLDADTEYNVGLHGICTLKAVRINSTSTLRAASTADIVITNCDITGTITISDDTLSANINIYNCSIAASSAGTNCITKAAGINPTVSIRYANNVFRIATTPINAAVLQGIVNTEDNQGNILV